MRVPLTYSGLISLLIWLNPAPARAAKPLLDAPSAAWLLCDAALDAASAGATVAAMPTNAVAHMRASSGAKLGSLQGKNVSTMLSRRSVKSSWPLVMPSYADVNSGSKYTW
jgi:hypothetical protein